MKWGIENGFQKEQIIVSSDSQILIHQMFVSWHIKKGIYVPLAWKALDIQRNFTRMSGKLIFKLENTEAIKLANQALIEAGVKKWRCI
jgi:hypothetical protein